jgi:hypothetical protein
MALYSKHLKQTIMSNTKQATFLKSWMTSNIIVYPLSLGILHPLISHGFLGDHGVQLTLPQFIMHTIAIMLFGVLLSVAQNRCLRLYNIYGKPMDGALYMSVLVTLFFWTGYYTFYIPFDILFMMLTIGAINAFRLRPYMKQPRKWMWQSMLTYFLGAAAGIGIGMAAFFGGVKDLPGLSRDIVLWLTISAPAGLVVALVSKSFLKAQIREVSVEQHKEQLVYELPGRDIRKPARAV